MNPKKPANIPEFSADTTLGMTNKSYASSMYSYSMHIIPQQLSYPQCIRRCSRAYYWCINSGQYAEWKCEELFDICENSVVSFMTVTGRTCIPAQSSGLGRAKVISLS